MRLYGQRFAKRYIDKRVNRKTETRDAILWDVDWNTFEARVKIQGTNEYVIAHFPRNWMRKPYWLKEGNAVSVRHRQGNRGYIEIIGEGRAVPTPVEGSVFPPEQDQPDMIISGCRMSESSPPQMAVVISSGTFRLDGTIYYLTPDVTGYIIMDDPAPMTMGSGDTMGSGGYTVSLDAAPSTVGHWRYDAVCVGTDLVIDYIKGVASTDPVKPGIPSDHLQLGGYILVQWDDTYVTDGDIGYEWTAPRPTTVTLSTSSYTGTISGENNFVWYAEGGAHWPNPECSVTISVKDQYGEAISPGAGGYDMTLNKAGGTGQVWSADSGYHADEVGLSCGLSSCSFRYQRNQTASPETSAVLTGTLSYSHDLTGVVNIMNLDISGEQL